MANNLLLELEARGIFSLDRVDCEAIFAAVVTNTAELARSVETTIARQTVPEKAGQP